MTVPVLLYRIISKRSRTWLLLRPSLFVGVRISLYVTRAVMSVVNYNVHTLGK